ncbi:MAG TPA: MotA/TolQ/ExbB proton channel family protein [Chthoniobacterales bacterium]|jgi:biopolymer transport protein ExbB|nr:MotA/TolQ/ExbB proton channel family protein [Chthoniobacterales bacterium]
MTCLALFSSPTDFIVNGGVFMWILLVCSFVAITVILLRLIALRKGAVIPRLIEKSIVGYRSGESLESIRRLVQDDDSAMGQILDAVVRSANATKAETLEIVQTRARREVVGLEAGLFILEIIVGISPLLGLLGAVTGLVKVFSNIGSGVTSTTDLKGIASGISECLSTTIVGLAIAILALIAWSTFTRRVETLAIQMESLVTELVEKFHQRRSEADSDHRPETLEEVTR